KYFKGYLTEMFSKYLNETKVNAPADFVLNHLVGSFAETVRWWIDNRMKYTPEETVRYYIEVTHIA
ncbi:MAG TPA: TetR family transcriptional regulator, partial [Peptococcaceae bacterium]|nr:TetR family transcriptional regulator [Peptococcaceae bacterium]